MLFSCQQHISHTALISRFVHLQGLTQLQKNISYNFFILVLAPKFNFSYLPPGKGRKPAATDTEMQERCAQKLTSESESAHIVVNYGVNWNNAVQWAIAGFTWGPHIPIRMKLLLE